MKALGHIPVESTRNNAGLPVARQNSSTDELPKGSRVIRKRDMPGRGLVKGSSDDYLVGIVVSSGSNWAMVRFPGGFTNRVKTSDLIRLNPQVTDRALRYRANEEPPEGPQICAMCGSNHFVEIDHIDGFEEHGDPENLMWLCRSCNTRKGIAMRNAGLGRRTHQYNPSGGAKNLGQWLQAVGAITPHIDRGDRGLSSDMKVSDAVAMIRATPQWKRSEFAQQLNKHKRRRRDEVPF